MKAIYCCIAYAALAALNGAPQAQELGPAPRFDAPQTASPAQPESVSLNPLNRYDVSLGYRLLFVPLASVAHGWTGNVSGCVAGTTSNAYQMAAIDRVNFFRALAGLPGNVALYGAAAQLGGTQDAALMMSRNNSLSHTPPTSWLCYTAAGSTAAGSSNIALGIGGTAAIDLYMDDFGSFNYFVGHRRWILYPPQTLMASGTIPSGAGFSQSNSLWVIGAFGTRPPTPNGVAWPPRGHVPYQMLPAQSNRWSLSYPGANFSAATVSMSVGGSSFGVTLEAFQNNVGYADNTIVWRPSTGSPGVSYARPTSADRRYTVNIANVSGTGVPTSFSYDVIVIDPADAVFAHGFQ